MREVREAWDGDRDRASERETQQTQTQKLQIAKCGMDGWDGMGGAVIGLWVCGSVFSGGVPGGGGH